MALDVRFSGQDRAERDREWFLDSFDNQTRQAVIIDLETHAVPVLLGICFLIGIAGNGALFYTICKSKRLRNVPNSFLLNVATVNILLLIICAPMVATSLVLQQQWPFGSVACKMVHSIPQAALAVSMFSLLGLSIERYGAFAAPPKHRVTAKNRACVGHLVIWIVGALCGLPLAIFAYEESYFTASNDIETKSVACGVFNRQLWLPVYPKIHTIVSISFLFLIPAVVCSIFYLSLSCVVCAKKQREKRQSDDESPLKSTARSSRSGTLTKTSSNTNTKTNTSRTTDSRYSAPTLKRTVRKRRTMAKVALVLILQFTLLWAAHWAYLLRWYFSYEKIDLPWYLVKLLGLVCVYLNAALTPFTVVICNKGFRHQLGKYLCCCCSCLHCCRDCTGVKKRRESEAAGSSLSIDGRSRRSKIGGLFYCPCCPSSADSDVFTTSTSNNKLRDIPDSGSYFNPPDQNNVYQELPEQNFYDAFTLPKPIANGYTTPHSNTLPHGPPSICLTDPHRASYSANPPYAASYAGDNNSLYGRPIYTQHPNTRSPELSAYHPVSAPGGRYSSEPVLHAQAPKFSKIYMPRYQPHLEQVTRMKEIPAM